MLHGEREIDIHRKVYAVYDPREVNSKEWLEWPMCKVLFRYTYRKLNYFSVTYEQCGLRLFLRRPISSSGFATVLKSEETGQEKTKSVIRHQVRIMIDMIVQQWMT